MRCSISRGPHFCVPVLPKTSCHERITELSKHSVTTQFSQDKLIDSSRPKLSRTESLRIKADYTGTEIDLPEAREVVQNAELFVQTVQRVFNLDESTLAKEYENSASKGDDKVSEPDVVVSEIKRKAVKLERMSSEEIRRQARENWLQLRRQKIGVEKGADHPKDADQRAKADQSHSIDNDLGQ
jgi:hypothetical protein